MRLPRHLWISLLLTLLVLFALFVAFIRYDAYLLRAHSTFENYYAFRGCEKLVNKSATDATCITGSGKTIRLVEFKGRWYLDGDLPTCLNAACTWRI